MFKNNPFSLYGENVFIILQNIVILGLFAKFSKDFSFLKLMLTYFLIGSISAPLIMQLVPAKIYEFALIINIVICNYSFKSSVIICVK